MRGLSEKGAFLDGIAGLQGEVMAQGHLHRTVFHLCARLRVRWIFHQERSFLHSFSQVLINLEPFQINPAVTVKISMKEFNKFYSKIMAIVFIWQW